MAKSDIVKSMQERTGESKELCMQMFNECIGSIVDACFDDKRVNVPLLGVLKLRECKTRQAHNPKTGEKITIPACNKMKFVPSADIKARLKAIKVY